MAVGHAWGYLASGKEPTFENGAFVYDTGYDEAVTFGNVITGGSKFLNETVIIGGQKDPLGRTNMQHEMSHVKQGTILGPGYIPTHAASLIVGGTTGMITSEGFMVGTHRYNIFEREWIDVPSYQ